MEMDTGTGTEAGAEADPDRQTKRQLGLEGCNSRDS